MDLGIPWVIRLQAPIAQQVFVDYDIANLFENGSARSVPNKAPIGMKAEFDE